MRKICVVTSTRADYGIMSRLVDMMHKDSDIELRLIVTGMHLSKKFGLTYKEINVPITKKINIDIEKEPAHTLALTIEKFSKEFKKLKPDLVVILGDRYEIMGVAQACMLNNIPIAHLHGGEITQGAIDDAIRHSITKMSHLHFTSCEEYAKRVIQLGEKPQTVFNVGSLGVENIKAITLLSKNELEKSINFKFGKKNLLVTFHPVTIEGNSTEQFRELLSALDELTETNIIITAPNSDKGNEELFRLIDNFVKNHKNVKYIKSLGMKRYLSAIRCVDAVVGNSSSGIMEVPSFKKATINIGSRQKGRIQASSIINCEPKKQDIINAIERVYKSDFSNVTNPYEKENTAKQILEIIKNFELNGIIMKEFYDINGFETKHNTI